MDWKWIVTAVLPVVTLVLGAWLNQLGEERRAEAALRRELRVRDLDREQSRLARREDFELTHLAAASERLRQILLDGVLAAVHRMGVWVTDHPEGETSADRYKEGVVEMNRLTGLILDDEIRQLVGTATAKLSELRWGERETVPERIVDAHAACDAAQQALAVRLRTIYTGAGPAALLPRQPFAYRDQATRHDGPPPR